MIPCELTIFNILIVVRWREGGWDDIIIDIDKRILFSSSIV